MQSTLLGLSIAIILVLVTALVGPLFIDWTQYRSFFEVEASRLVGMPVRITGDIDARVLPTPSLTLRGIRVGRRGDEMLLANELAIEFGLGPLLSGQWRATQMHLVEPDLKIGVDQSGRIDRFGIAQIDPDQLSIQRLSIQDGHAVLTEATSDTKLVLDKVSFNGELRSLIGPIKGDGGFSIAGERYGYRLSVGRLETDESLRIRLGLDSWSLSPSVETDGMVRLDRGIPRFEGLVTLAQSMGTASRDALSLPWRLSGHVRADAAQATFEKIEFQYGPEERAAKLTGSAEIKFGRSPQLGAAFSGRQLDLDRVLDRGPTAAHAPRRSPVAELVSFGDALSAAFRLPMPAQVDVGIDSIIIAGSPVQALHAGLRINGPEWNLDSLEFRAPGAAQARASGRLHAASQGTTFAGPARLEVADPKALMAWLTGRSDLRFDQISALSAAGNLTVDRDRLTIDALQAQVDGRALSGKLAYQFAKEPQPSHLDATLKAPELDLDGLAPLLQSAVARAVEPPVDGASLALDVDQATMAGLQAKSVSAKLHFDANGPLVIDQLAVSDIGGATVNLRGRLDTPWSAPRGTLALDLDASKVGPSIAALARVAPEIAEAVQPVQARLTPVHAHAVLDLSGKAGQPPDRHLRLDASAGSVSTAVTAELDGDAQQWSQLRLRLDGKVEADDATVLTRLAKLDHLIAVEPHRGTLTVSASGPLGNQLSVDTSIIASGLGVAASGTVRPTGDAPTANLKVTVAAADIGAALGGKVERPFPIKFTSEIAVAPDALTLENLSGTLMGTDAHGRLAIALKTPVRLEGRIESDTVDAASLLSAAIGLHEQVRTDGENTQWSAEPVGEGLFDHLSGRLEVAAAQARLTPTLAATQLHGTLNLAGGELSIENLQAQVAGGHIVGDLGWRRQAGTVTGHGRLAATDIDIATLVGGSSTMVVTGKVAADVEAEASGLSPAALVGSLKGTGTVTLTDGQILGLDPKAFGAATNAVDQGMKIDATKIHDLVVMTLDAGRLAVPRADGSISIEAGQVRLAKTVIHANGADVTAAGDLDLLGGQVDASLVLAGRAAEPQAAEGRQTSDNVRPVELYIGLKGPLSAANRTVDVAALVGWLTVRSVDRQTQRLEAIEGDQGDSAVGSIGQGAGTPHPPAPANNATPAPADPHPAPADQHPTPHDPRADATPAASQHAATPGVRTSSTSGTPAVRDGTRDAAHSRPKPPPPARPLFEQLLFGSQR